MKSTRNIIFLVLGSFVISAGVIAGLAYVLTPATSRSALFDLKIIWTIFLSGLVWGACGNYFMLSATRRGAPPAAGGIAPSVWVLAISYSASSFFVMIFCDSVLSAEVSSRIHLATQICLAGIFGIVFLCLNIARSHAGLGLQTDFDDVSSPATLSSRLSAVESWLRSQGNHDNWECCARLVKQLREVITYSLNQTGGIMDNPSYSKFASDVQSLDQLLRSCADPSSPVLASCMKQVQTLVSDAKRIAQDAVRRQG